VDGVSRAAAGSARAGTRGAAPNVVAAGGWHAATPLAAFLNGTAAVALELDESLPTGGHPAAHVVPAALAVAQERDCDGARLAAAVVLGYEVAARLYRAHRFTYPAHPHGALGAIGAAVAVALLRESDPRAAARAAATLPLVATWEPCFEGATARNAWTGAAALVGVLACDLAEAGIDGSAAAPQQLLELLTEPAATEELTAPLDPGALAVTRSWTRVHGAAGPLHTAIEAALQLRDRRRAAGDERALDAVVVETFERNRKFDRLPAANDLSARFSLPYVVAAALDGELGSPSSFVYDARVAALAERVEVRVAADIEATWPARAAARVTVASGGEQRHASCELPLGHPERPLTAAERRARRAALLGAGVGAAALDGIATRTSVADLLRGIA
ncbi:MmgE/PrpD family protein, partial [Conexibacter stalactiti]